MKNKIIISAMVGVLALAGAAHAERTPFLYGNYSANVLESYGAEASVATPSAERPSRALYYSGEKAVSPTRLFGQAGVESEPPLGNYAPNIRLEDVRGHY